MFLGLWLKRCRKRPALGGGRRRETHGKLGQHVSSSSHSDANHVLEPGGEHSWSLQGQGRRCPPLPSAGACWPCGGTGHPLAPSPGKGPGGTHPKCCTTLGSMAASCSMEGNWYLRVERVVRAGRGLDHGAGAFWSGECSLVPTPGETATPPPAARGRPRGTPRSAW